jgi:hypothetical protein
MRSVSRWLLLLGLVCGASAALADEGRPYTEGPVVTVTSVRTKVGMFDEYMKFVAGNYRRNMEEYKKAGLILDYGVYQAFPHNPHEPDLFLTVTFKNWAAFDGLQDKMDPIDAKVYGSVDASNKGAVDRDKIRDILGSQTIQKLQLK